jgi:Cft2 family RNA processing exonuclease
MLDPATIERTDYLLIESTYGDRQHDTRDPTEALAEIVETTIARGGTVVIPAFAVGRAQSLMFHLQRLKSQGRLANIPIFLDSPMAVDASEIFCANIKDQKLPEAECRRTCAVAHYVQTIEESKALTVNRMPKVIISASGMATGGRVLHHLKQYVPDAKNTVLFAGFQAGGTRGAAMMAGANSIKMHGEYVPAGKGAQFFSRSALKPWNNPQSTRIRCLSCSTRYFDPVTVPAPPKNVRFKVTVYFSRMPSGLTGSITQSSKTRCFTTLQALVVRRPTDLSESSSRQIDR